MLFKVVQERHARERESLIEKQREERGKLGEGIVVKTDLNAVEAEVSILAPRHGQTSINGGNHP